METRTIRARKTVHGRAGVVKEFIEGFIVVSAFMVTFGAVWELSSSLPKIAANTKRIADALEKLVEFKAREALPPRARQP